MPIDTQARTLSDLDVYNFRRLVTALQKDQGWRKVAEFVGIFDQNEISSLSLNTCPAESLLDELGTKLLSLKTLALILKECSQYDAFLVISEPEQMHIVLQPTSILQGKNKLHVNIGEPLELQFDVTGIPPPKFQWFKDDEILADQTAALLGYEQFEPNMEGEYFCYATQGCDSINSDIVNVETLPYPCVVSEKPNEFIYVREGSPLLLPIKAVGYPKPTFQWLHENTVLENETKNILYIKQTNKDHSGEYRCFVSNHVSEEVVKTGVIVHEENSLKIYKKPVSDKIALLIANSDYKEQESLTCPSNDVSTVAKILQTRGFETICLQNLNLREFKIAIELFASFVSEDSFALFYYAGHGFMMGDKFLLPVDSPDVKNFKKSNAVLESMILQRVLNKNPIVFVFLLDMCLKLPNEEENPGIYKEVLHLHTFEPNRNLIKGYSTTNNLAAYEVKGNENGIYVSILKKYLGCDLSIFTILGKVNEEISGKCPRQMPDISRNTAYEFYLNNPLREQTANKKYEIFDICEEETWIGSAKIYLQKYKGVFDNAFDICISDAETIKYAVNSSEVTVEKQENGKVVLRVSDLQKLTSDCLKLIVNGTDFDISRWFKIGNLFFDI